MARVFERGDSTFHQLADGSYVEADTGAGWTGVSRFQHGLVTGRPSPNVAVRPRRITDLQNAAGQRPGAAGPGQGMLFEPPTRSVGETLSLHGVPERRASSGEGFLPRLGNVAGAASPEDREAIANEKAKVIANAAKITAHAAPGLGADPAMFGTPTPLRKQMENRERHVSSGVTGNWYDQESEEVESLAQKHSVPHGNMRRAVAALSPQKPWVYGNLQDSNLVHPNLEAADAVASTVAAGRRSAANRGVGFDPGEHAAEHTLVPRVGTDKRNGEPTPGEMVHPQTKGNMAKAGRALGVHYDPSSAMVTGAQKNKDRSMVGEKVPNFDLALAAGHQSPTVRREAAQAYTSDTWDVRSAGIPNYAYVGGGGMIGGKPKDWPSANPRGQYDVVAMTGRRAGLRAGMLPSEMQQHVWRVGKGVGVGSGSTEAQQQMFPPEVHTGRRVRKAAH